MKRKYLIYTVLFTISFFFSFEINASDSFIYYENNLTSSDSIVIKNSKKGIAKVIHKGDKIRIWWGKSYPVTGYLKSIKQDTLVLTINNIDNKVHKNQIEKIQVFSNKKQKIKGWIIVGLGIVLMVFVGFAGAAIGGMMDSVLLAILFGIISSLPGLGIVKLGNNIKARKFKIGKKWKIL